MAKNYSQMSFRELYEILRTSEDLEEAYFVDELIVERRDPFWPTIEPLARRIQAILIDTIRPGDDPLQNLLCETFAEDMATIFICDMPEKSSVIEN